MFIGWIIEEREKGSRIERLMLLISSWKIESVEWLLSLIKMLDNNETTYSFPISSYTDSFKNCSINVKCNRIWSTFRLFHLIIINIPLESLEQRQKLFSNLFTKLQ